MKKKIENNDQSLNMYLSKKFSPRFGEHIYKLFLIIIVGGLFFRLQKISVIPFHDWDESIYARLAKEGLSQFVFPQYLSTPWLEKPPFPIFIWQFLVNLGKPEVSLRFVSLLVSIGIIFLVLKLIKRINTDSTTSSLQTIMTSSVGLSILISSNFFLDRSLLVNVDLFLLFSWLGYIYFRNQNNLILNSIFIFIGVMSKSILGFFPLVIDLFFILISKNTKRLKSFFYKLPLLIIPSLIWFVLAYFRYGRLFINEHFRDHLFLRLVQPIELHFGGKLFYLIEIQKDFSLMSLLIITLIISTLIIYFRNFKKVNLKSLINQEIFLIAVSITLYLFFLTFTKSKLSWYIGPLIPLIAILSATLFNYILRNFKHLSYLIFAIILLVGFYQFSLNTYFWHPRIDNFAATTLLGKCIYKHHQNNKVSPPIKLLVASNERETAHVLEAAKLNISTSFRYAGMPGMIYYAYPQLFEIFYKEDLFQKSLVKSDFLVIKNTDLRFIPSIFSSNSICKVSDWNYLQLK